MSEGKNDPAAMFPEFVTLYHRAFADYGTRALWNLRAFDIPTPQHALTVARTLRIEGDIHARSLAEEIERAGLAAA